MKRDRNVYHNGFNSLEALTSQLEDAPVGDHGGFGQKAQVNALLSVQSLIHGRGLEMGTSVDEVLEMSKELL